MADKGIKLGKKTYTLDYYVYEIKKHYSIKLKRAMPKRICENAGCTKSLPKHVSLFPRHNGLRWYSYYGYQKGGRFCTKKCSDLWSVEHFSDYGLIERSAF